MYVSANLLLSIYVRKKDQRFYAKVNSSILFRKLDFMWILWGFYVDFNGIYANFIKFCTHFMHILLTLNNAV